MFSEFKRFSLDLTALRAWCSRDRVNTSALVSSRRAAVWTMIRADKRSVWRNSNESRGFVPLLAHKHYIEHLSNSSYRFIEENYITIIIVIELSPRSIQVQLGKVEGFWSALPNCYNKQKPGIWILSSEHIGYWCRRKPISCAMW